MVTEIRSGMWGVLILKGSQRQNRLFGVLVNLTKTIRCRGIQDLKLGWVGGYRYKNSFIVARHQ